MKKILILSVWMLSSWMIQAQPKVTSAYNANKEGKYEEARQYIDDAMADPKATEKEKFWRYRGDIYMNIAITPELNSKYPEAMSTAVEAYTNALNRKSDYQTEIAQMLLKGFGISEKAYIDLYEKKEFCQAKIFVNHCAQILKVNKLITQKSEAAQLIDGADKTIKENQVFFNNQCISQTIDMLVKSGKQQEALELIREEKTKDPNNVGLLSFEADIYLSLSDYQNASKSLEVLVANNPKVAIYHYYLGNLFEKIDGEYNNEIGFLKNLRPGDSQRRVDSLLVTNEIIDVTKKEIQYSFKKLDKSFDIILKNGKIDKITEVGLSEEIYSDRAENEYKICLSLDSAYYDANYNLGAIYFNRSEIKNQNCGKIKDDALYKECKASTKLGYAEAAKYFDRCYQADIAAGKPVDLIKKFLKQSLIKSGNAEKATKL